MIGKFVPLVNQILSNREKPRVQRYSWGGGCTHKFTETVAFGFYPRSFNVDKSINGTRLQAIKVLVLSVFLLRAPFHGNVMDNGTLINQMQDTGIRFVYRYSRSRRLKSTGIFSVILSKNYVTFISIVTESCLLQTDRGMSILRNGILYIYTFLSSF